MPSAPNKTAYKSYYYNMDIGFDTKSKLDTAIQKLHKYNSERNRWKYIPLKQGSFGYDNLAISIVYTLNKIKSKEKLENKSIEKVADYVHCAWSKNYVYWRDNEPWLNGTYIKSAKKLDDKNRNLLAETNYEDLPEDEKEKDRIIARFIKEFFLYL
jgi:hypothetical protein